jgi:hypothetical protein
MTLEQLKELMQGKRAAFEAALKKDEIDVETIIKMYDEGIKTQSDFGEDSFKKQQSSKKKYEQMLADAGYDPTKHSSLDDLIAERVAESPASSDDRVKLLEARLEKMQTALDAKEKDTNVSQIKEKLRGAFEKANFHKGATPKAIKELLADERVDIVDGEIVFRKDGNIVPFDDGFNEYLSEDDNKSLISSTQTGGSGSQSSSAGRVITQADLAILTKDELKDPVIAKQVDELFKA